MATERWLWLSHQLSENTPVYGDGQGPKFTPELQIDAGDSCNTTIMHMQNHIGSHVDAPLHFVPGGQSIGDYAASDWVFNRPLFIELQMEEKQIVEPEHLDRAVASHITGEFDLILIKTGFERYRGERSYWETPPGYSPELANYLLKRFGPVRAIAMDTISISSFANRSLGREAHHAFLGQGIRLFEDMRFTELDESVNILEVITTPLRFDNADGAPVTAIARVS